MKPIIAIVSVAANGVIGNKGEIPWKCQSDMKHFKETTSGHAVIMGRKTWESLPSSYKPLPNRYNVIITSNPDWSLNHLQLNSLPEAIKRLQSMDFIEKIFLIGGQKIYEDGLDFCSDVIVSEMEGIFPGDAFFPIKRLQTKEWSKWVLKNYQASLQDSTGFSIVNYSRQEL